MRHPLWILNSSLLLLLLISVGFIVFTWNVMPPKPSTKKASALQKISTDLPLIDVAKIYENDLFDTYHEQITPTKEENYSTPLPTPPSPSKVVIPDEPITPFLPPLPVTLKGIMIVNDESKNLIIVEDNASKKEENYKIGDTIEDAQLVRILHNKAILVRSNGQFETLFLSEKDITQQPAVLAQKDGWKSVIVRHDAIQFELDPAGFAEIVPGLSQCIDMFDLTTIYRKGKSVGCRIGSVVAGSLAEALGLRSQDVILSVAGISTATPDNRYEIYERLVSLKLGDVFTVELDRNGRITSYVYTLSDLTSPLNEFNPEAAKAMAERVGILQGPTPTELEEEKIAMLKEQYKFAQTTQDLLVEQRQMMYEHTKAETTVSLLNEAQNP